MVGIDDVTGALAQLLLVIDDGPHVNAHTGPFTGRLDEEWEFQVGAQRLVACNELLEGSHGQAPVAPDSLGQCLVEGDAVGQDA